MDTNSNVYTAAIVRRGDTFLMLYHAGIKRWVFPGGKPEPGEDLGFAVVREFQEETGIALAMVRYHKTITTNDGKGTNWEGHYFLGWTGAVVEPVIVEPKKHTGLWWMTLEDMVDNNATRPVIGIVRDIMKQ